MKPRKRTKLKRIKPKRKIRIKRKTKRKRKTKKTKKIKKPKPNVGDKVKIAIKPYTGKTATGIVERVLTKKKYHSRGHKVRLTSGKVGRILKIIKRHLKGGKCRYCKNCGNRY